MFQQNSFWQPRETHHYHYPHSKSSVSSENLPDKQKSIHTISKSHRSQTLLLSTTSHTSIYIYIYMYIQTSNITTHNNQLTTIFQHKAKCINTHVCIHTGISPLTTILYQVKAIHVINTYRGWHAVNFRGTYSVNSKLVHCDLNLCNMIHTQLIHTTYTPHTQRVTLSTTINITLESTPLHHHQ